MSDYKIDTLEVESQIIAPAATTSVAGLQSPADKTKLDSVESGATANSTDAQLRDRATHTGTQTSSTISDFTEASQDSAASMITGATHDGVSSAYNDASNTLALTNTDKGSVARAAHEAAVDPHPQYETSAEAQAKADAAQAFAIQRSNHTGSQTSSTISDFAATVRSTVLTGYTVGANAALAAADTILAAFGKVQGQINAIITTLAGKANLAGGNTITGTQSFSGGTIVFDAAGETRFGIGGYTDPDVGTQYNIKYGGTGRSMAVRGISYFLDQMGIGAQTPVASAKLQIDSTTQGFLVPRMTTAQRTAIATPATGLQVFDTTLSKLFYYDGVEWVCWTVFGSEYQDFQDSVQSTTTSGAQPLTAVASSFTTTNVPAGRYRIGIQYYWTNNSGVADSRFQVFVDGVAVENQHAEELQDNTSTKHDQIITTLAFGSAGTHTIELRFGSEGLITTTVNRVICEFWRVS